MYTDSALTGGSARLWLVIDVLNALSRTYSIIHLACHGTFDPVEPDRSFLYFDADHERDSKRVSAAELSAVRFP